MAPSIASNALQTITQQKKYLVSGFKIGAVTRFIFLFVNFCFALASEICDTCIRGYWNQTKFPIHKVWWLRETSKSGKRSIIPLCDNGLIMDFKPKEFVWARSPHHY